jgi:hypothetical protein
LIDLGEEVGQVVGEIECRERLDVAIAGYEWTSQAKYWTPAEPLFKGPVKYYNHKNVYLDRLGNKLLHVHLSENDGTADQHLPLGAAPRSTTDWPGHIKKLKASGYDGTITLEVFAPQKEYLLLSRDLLRRWWVEA